MKTEVNIKAIAEALNVSISTVSRALRNNPRIGVKTKERVLAKAAELKYVANPATMFLHGKNTNVVGVIVPSLSEEFFFSVIKHLEDEVESEGYSIFVVQSRDEKLRQNNAIDLFLKYRVDGIVVSLAAETNNYEKFKKVEDFGIPVVFFDRVPRSFSSHQIKCGIEQGAKETMAFLKAKNRKKIALINGPSNLAASDDRLNGYLKGLKELNMFSSPTLIKSCDLTKTSAAEAMKSLLLQEIVPDAVFTFNDYVALYAMQECKKNNIAPNKDILFSSYANLPITTLMDNPPLTSVEQFPDKIGIETANLLLSLMKEGADIKNHQSIVVETKLVVH
ncbi:LacI family transcriptional regulator [Lacihabitans sp. LS3-19]|uniref:LacI family DNA-binding transcriptional regulator n=1 Tax=Lacihabitans sp. LS3-19 TaxID=2487335 RepID=UPI0020CC152F|nr:LacI family DNA-binding transcriptional regulator [Lacihabitans sp. LS3-19]MCP9766866.1 LacI family transcriptional regulator [Lacihabitans sp. LS3-19]